MDWKAAVTPVAESRRSSKVGGNLRMTQGRDDEAMKSNEMMGVRINQHVPGAA